MAKGHRLPAPLLAVLALAEGIHLREERQPARAGNPIHTWFNSHKPKVFFVASLEGCGTAVVQRLWKDSFIWEDSHLQHVVKFPPEWWRGQDWRFREYDEMTSRVAKVKVNDIWALPFQATYPSCGVRQREHTNRLNRYHPDLLWIRGAVEAAKTSLHYIFMHRPLIDALKLTCMTRHYDRNCQLQAVTLIKNADILMSQLKLSNRSQMSCFHYTTDEDVQELVKFYFGKPEGVTNPKVHVRMPPSLAEEFKRRDISKKPEPDINVTEELNKKSAELRRYCESMDQFTLSDLKDMILYAHGDLEHLHQVIPVSLAEDQAGNVTANRGNITRPGTTP